ncbi:MAG TPA: erythromycin esterase family protein [Chitinophaga sp.]|uniref:erythromycin esterase family protein n=1 Tax=Chitinophaga sp. TaxID=1869181 RepID=UPI002BDAE635|nr:erythromycin esterase family protein [Chitinophaga sp.]HVI48353.1 erythromycin esterase family protein [Chitinophaga sp.]
MKLTFTCTRIFLLLLFIGSQAVAQRAVPTLAEQAAEIHSIDPADTSYTDLQELEKAVGNARIVMLGEQTHGEGSTCLAKIRLIKFLHEKMGFEVLAFESGLYDCARIWENTRNGGDLKKEVIGSLFYMWATSKQMYPLFDYIQARTNRPDSLVIAGFESQHSGLKAQQELFKDFETFLNTRQVLYDDSTWASFKRISVAMFASPAYRPSAAEQQRFFWQIDVLKLSLTPLDTTAGGHFTQSPGFWYRITCSIESQAKRYWQLVSGNEVSVRDYHMAQNLIWLATKAYPKKKIIVWAHNVHITKNTNTLQPLTTGTPLYFFSTYVPMGSIIHEHFGKKAYAIGFSGAKGSYMDYTNDKIIPVTTITPESIEGQLSSSGHPYLFLDYRRIKGERRQTQISCLADFMPLKATWENIFDGLFFIDKVFPVDR